MVPVQSPPSYTELNYTQYLCIEKLGNNKNEYLPAYHDVINNNNNSNVSNNIDQEDMVVITTDLPRSAQQHCIDLKKSCSGKGPLTRAQHRMVYNKAALLQVQNRNRLRDHDRANASKDSMILEHDENDRS
eukprot:Awhi_evm1s14232